MRWVGAAAATVLLVVFTTQVWPRNPGRTPRATQAQPLGKRAVRTCARQVINDWVRDGRIREGYRRECYQAALDIGTRGGVNPVTVYGASVFAELQERLRTSR